MKNKKQYAYNVLFTDGIFFPGCRYSFVLTDEVQIAVIDDAVKRRADIFVVSLPSEHEEREESEVLSDLGTITIISNLLKEKNGTKVTVECKYRANITDVDPAETALHANAIKYEVGIGDLSGRERGLLMNLFKEVKKTLKEISKHDPRLSGFCQNVNQFKETEVEEFINQTADFFVSRRDERRMLLVEPDAITRLDILKEVLEREVIHMQIASRIANQTRKNMDKHQREYFLREQMKVIGEELGDDTNEHLELLAKLETSGAPDEVMAKIRKDIQRFQKTNPMSPEFGVLRNYIEAVLDLPWKEQSQDQQDLKKAREVLDTDHYNMEEVKDRIIEHIAVMQLNKNLPGQILCLVGPPGVGKTSIAESVAKALNRSFVRVSLGGVKDESEIRGHRKTYVGSMPGKVINGMKKAKTQNPVFLFDEIDKMAHDTYRGDPASAMLEVLDPVQNKTFTDHYLEVPYDLSHVLFICTANDEAGIPWALQDRMEILNLSSYTLVEKIMIANQFLLPRLASEHGIKKGMLSFPGKSMEFLIERYTKEAGVRDLSRVIGSLYRKIALKVVVGEINATEKVTMDEAMIVSLLGKEKYSKDDLEKNNSIGVVNGLSYTAVGGDILKLEVVLTPGKGELRLTGRLGDVMKESAQIALSVTKSLANQYKIDSTAFEKKDIHVHVPSGAIPKDGPSAGVALVVAMVSAFSGRAIRGDFALTGEVTLSGRVLEIGGVREKILSAYRYGITNVIMPSRNEKNLDKVPEEAKKGIKFQYVDKITEVLTAVLV